MDSKKKARGSYKWWVVGMLWLVCFFNYADRQAIFSLFPLLEEEMGLDKMQFGVVGGAFMWVYAAMAPLAGAVGDRFRRKTLILAGLAFWSLITVATALSRRYEHLVVFRALEGLGEAFYFPASMSMISDWHDPRTRSRAMSIHQSSVYVGTVAGATVAGILGMRYGWRSGFYLFGGLGMLLSLALLAVLREPERSRSVEPGPGEAAFTGGRGLRGAGKGVVEVFSNPLVLLLMTVFVGANFVAAVFLTWLPTFLHEKFQMNLGLSGFTGTAFLQSASILGVLSGGVLADRLARRRPGGRMLTQALGLLGGFPFIFLTGWTLSVPVLVAAMIAFGWMKGLYDSNIWASLHDVVRPELRATAVGWMNAVAWVGGGVAPVAVAFAARHFGMSVSISATSLVYLLAGLLLLAGVAVQARRRASLARRDARPQPAAVEP